MKKRNHYMLLIILFFLIVITLFKPPLVENSSQHVESVRKSAYLDSGDELKQEFVSKVEYFHSLGLIFRTDNSFKEQCEISMELRDKSDNVLASKKLNKNQIFSDYYNYLEFDTINNSKGQHFVVIVKNECDKGISIDYYDSNEGIISIYNDVEISKGIFFVEKGYNKVYSYIGCLVGLILIELIVIIMIDDKGGKNGNVKKNKK